MPPVFKDDGYNTFWAELGDERVAELQLTEDDRGRVWLMSVDTEQEYRRRGMASGLVERAVEMYGEVFVSTAGQGEHEMWEGDWDIRWLTEDGAGLVQGCVKKGILKQEWLIHPFHHADAGDADWLSND